MTIKRILTVMLSLVVGITIVLLAFSIARAETLNIQLGMVGLVVFSTLLIAHIRGWRWSAHATVILATLFTIIANPADLTHRQVSFTVLAPVVIAAVLLPWYWGIAAFVACMIGIALQSGGQGPLFGLDVLTIATFVAAGVSFAGFVARTAQRDAETHARRAEEARARAAEQAQELAEANELMTEQLDQQSKLLDLVTTLETPVVPLAAGMLFAPIVGHIDTRRATALTTRLLQEASTQRARLVLLDIAGVAMIDTAVAKALLHTIQALRLLGCEVILSGISASVAMALIHLGINLDEVRTVRSPQEALAYYLGAAARPAERTRPMLLKDQNPAPIKTNGPMTNN